MNALGRTTWVIPEGYIPSESTGEGDALVSHETACLLNTGAAPVQVRMTLFFADSPPIGPYEIEVAAERTYHLRFNDLRTPQPVPRDTDYASVIEASAPIVVQHTRLDSRQAELALLSTMAFPVGGSGDL